MLRRHLVAVLAVLIVIASAGLAAGQSGAAFGPGPSPDAYNPQASIYGEIGLWKVLSAETPPSHSFGTSGWIDRINRNPGQLTITQTGTSLFFAPSSRVELGLRVNVNTKIQSRREDELGLGQATLNSLNYSGGCPGCPILGGPVPMPGTIIPQLRNPLNNQLTGRTGYYPLFPYVNRRLQAGFGDVEVSGKINIASEQRGQDVSFAIRPFIDIPTHRDPQALLNTGGQTGTVSSGIDAILSKRVGDAAGLYLNVGYEYLPADKHAGATLIGSTSMIPIRAGINLPRTGRLQAIIELTSENYLNQGTPNSTFGSPDPIDATGGLRWYIKSWIALNGAYRHTLNQSGGDKNGFFFALTTSNYPIAPAPALPMPPTVSCSADPARATPGTMVRLTAIASTTTGRTLSYAWTSPDGRIDGSGPSARYDTTGLRAGDHTATVRVSDGADGFADCTTTIVIYNPPPPPKPPTASCSVDRSSVTRGEAVNFSVNANSPDGRPLTYAWSGAVRGAGRTARLDTTSLNAGSYTGNAHVTDDRGLSADCSASTNVTIPAPPPPPEAKLLNTCSFTGKSNKLKPARVDNACKAILDDIALRLQSDSDATAVLVGNADPTEVKVAKGSKKAPADLGAQRASNVKGYLVEEKGLAGNRMEVRSASGGPAEVQIHLVPRGATYRGAGAAVTEPKAVVEHKKKAAPAADKKMDDKK